MMGCAVDASVVVKWLVKVRGHPYLSDRIVHVAQVA